MTFLMLGFGIWDVGFPMVWAMGTPQQGAPSAWVQLMPFVLVVGIFYFVILLPMKRRQQKVQAFLAALKVGDRITVYGDIVVIAVKGRRVQVRVVRASAPPPEPVMFPAKQPDGRPETDERARRFDQFRNGEAQILISTEVGSEGLDLQFCHILINYDLPWNPMVVEQRIGRLDRLGQQSERIVIANFSIPGTIEDRVLTRLYERIGIFKHSVGELEPILGEHIRKLTRVLMSSQLTEEEREAQIAQTAAILERKRQELDDLEVKSAHLIGHDEFFNLELDRVKRLRRYVTGKELRTLVSEFLQRQFPSCELQGEGEVCELIVDDRLTQFLRDELPETDRWLLQFLNRAMRGRVAVTFDSETAYRRSDIEFLANAHPLIRAVRAFYQRNPASLHPASRVALRISNVREGDYLFEVFVLDIKAIRRTRVLEAILINVSTEEQLPADQAEEVLSLIVEQGETLS